KSVLIVGGGSIGCEFVSIFNAFGIPVILIHTGERLLRNMDSEMSRLLHQVFESLGIHILLGTSIRAAERVNGELKVSLETGEVLRPDIALFAAGRTVKVECLGLEVDVVKLGHRGAIV